MHMLWLADSTVPAGNQITNTAAETAFSSVAPVIWTNTDQGPNVGRSFKIEAYGYYSTAASSPGTLTFRVKLGTTLLHATVPALALPASVVNAGWAIKGYMQITKTGPAGGTVNTNAATPSGNVLNFAAVPGFVAVGMFAKDLTAAAGVIPGGATVTAKGTSTVTLSQNVTGAGVGNGDTIAFANGAVSFQAEGWLNQGVSGNQGTPLMFDLINPGTGTSGQMLLGTQSPANISLTAQFSVASASNIVTMTQLLVEEIG
jgi:hypothetical protein